MNCRKLLARLPLLIVIFLSGTIAFGSSRQDRKPFEIPFQPTNNLIILRGSINGSKPLSLLLDTGAGGSVINESRAKELGLKLKGQTEAATGDGAVEASFVKGVELNISGLKLSDLTLTAIDLRGLEAGFGQPIDGILGYDIFAEFVVEIDYVTQRVRLHKPKSYKYSGSGQTIPITIEDNRPFIRGEIVQPGATAVEGRFEFDIGQIGAVTLGKAFTSKNDLLKSTSGTLQVTTGAILAGKSNVQIGRIQNLRLGRFVIKNPITTFAPDNRGEEDTTDYAGLVGGEILRRFRVVVDYSRRRVVLEPNKHFSEPYEFDMSGASLTSGGSKFNTFKVRALVENSPASEMGLRVGDEIIAIDGKSTEGMTLEKIRRMFRQARRKYVISIKRNALTMQISLTTRRLI
jgi:predicted aspartyl protease